ncbi:MAG: hypothetical protein DRP62_01540 [Planctomycetota bacterium]|nr:MAG: hypothetical protein DRP62_01540 [Planctomycetota bacterium]
MTVEEYKDLVRTLISSNSFDMSVLAIGKPGIGKTQAIFDLADELDIEVFYLPFSTLADRTDIRIGVPDKETGRMVFLYSEELPTTDKSGILLLDDITDADRYLMASAKSLLYERKLSRYRVPDNVIVVATGNPIEEGGLTAIDKKSTTRVLKVDVEVSLKGWIKWAKDKGIHPLVIQFISYKPDALYYDDGNTVIAPRNWEIVSKAIKSKVRLSYIADQLGSIYVEFKVFAETYKSRTKFKKTWSKICSKKQPDHDVVKSMKKEELYIFVMGFISYLLDIKNEKTVIKAVEWITSNPLIDDEYKTVFMKSLLERRDTLASSDDIIEIVSELSIGE